MVDLLEVVQSFEIQDGVQDGRQNTWSIISGTNLDRNIILVSRIGFSGSGHSKKIFLTFSDNHVTFSSRSCDQYGRLAMSCNMPISQLKDI